MFDMIIGAEKLLAGNRRSELIFDTAIYEPLRFSDVKIFQIMTKNLINRHKLMLIGTLSIAIGVTAALLIVKIPQYLHDKEVHRDWKDLDTICANLIELQGAKFRFCCVSVLYRSDRFRALTNGQPITWEDIEPFLNGHGVPRTLTNIAQMNVCGEKYILDPIGASVEAELPRPMCGLRRGTQISAEYASIIDKLYAIERIKVSNGISRAHKIWQDETNRTGSQFDDTVAAYIVNPPRVPPKARLKQSIPEYPAGTEISFHEEH